MNEKLLNYLRLGRAHTYPADWLLMIVPFLAGSGDILKFVVLSIFMFGVHWFSFGENSLHDYTQGYDKDDSSKSHHPLVTGKLSVHSAVNAIHWTKALMGTLAVILILAWSPNVTMAMASLFLWFAWGTAYNLGLSKESLLGFIPIVLCFVTMGAWGWFMSHVDLAPIGLAYLIYAGMVIWFQIAWSGHLKDIKQNEPSNLLSRLGAAIHEWQRITPDTFGKDPEYYEVFYPNRSLYLGLVMKISGILSLVYLASFAIGLPLDLGNLYSLSLVVWTLLMVVGMIVSMMLILPQREWNKAKELRNMSIMEIFSIFAPIPLLVSWPVAALLMIFSLAYFYLGNKKLWGVSYPKV